MDRCHTKPHSEICDQYFFSHQQLYIICEMWWMFFYSWRRHTSAQLGSELTFVQTARETENREIKQPWSYIFFRWCVFSIFCHDNSPHVMRSHQRGRRPRTVGDAFRNKLLDWHLSRIEDDELNSYISTQITVYNTYDSADATGSVKCLHSGIRFGVT